MQKSEGLNELFNALAKARAEFKEIKKTESNPFYKSKYADLSNIISATFDALSKHGLVVIQLPSDVSEGSVKVETVLGHSSGQWISETIVMPMAKSDAQGVGSATSYARRYSLQSLLNVAADVDDDGEAAVSRIKEAEKRFDDARISPANIRKFWQEARKTGKSNDQISAYLAELGYKQTEEIKQSEYDAALAFASTPPSMPQDLLPALSESLDMANARKRVVAPVKPTGDHDPFWASFWPLLKKHGVSKDDVHTYAREHHGMKDSLTELDSAKLSLITKWVLEQRP